MKKLKFQSIGKSENITSSLDKIAQKDRKHRIKEIQEEESNEELEEIKENLNTN